MRVEVQDGKIVVTTENKNEEFSRDICGLVSMDIGAPVRISKAYPIGTVHEVYEFSEYDFAMVARLVVNAQRCGIEVEQAVIDRMNELDRQRHELFEKKQRDFEEQKKRDNWQHLQKCGCGRCKNLRQNADEFTCASCGKTLKTKNVPFYDYSAHIQYQFNLEPFPSEDCPLRAEQEISWTRKN